MHGPQEAGGTHAAHAARPPWPVVAGRVPERPPSVLSTGSQMSAKFKPAPETAAADVATQFEARALAEESAAAIAAAAAAAVALDGRGRGGAAAAGPADVAGAPGTAARANSDSSFRQPQYQHAARPVASAPSRPRQPAHRGRGVPGPRSRSPAPSCSDSGSPHSRRSQSPHERHPRKHSAAPAERAAAPRQEEWEMAHNSALIMIMEAHAQAMRASPSAGAPEAPFSLDQKLPQDSRKFARQPEPASSAEGSAADRSGPDSGPQPPHAGSTSADTVVRNNTATLALPPASATLGQGSHGSAARYSSLTLPHFGASAEPVGSGDSLRSSKMPVFGLVQGSSSAAVHNTQAAGATTVDSATWDPASPRNSIVGGTASEARVLTHSLSLAGGYSLLQPQSMVQSGDQSSQRADRRGDSGGHMHASVIGTKSLASIHTAETWDDAGPSGHRKISMLGGLPMSAPDAADLGTVNVRVAPADPESPRSTLSALSSPDAHKDPASPRRRLSPRFPPLGAGDGARPRSADEQQGHNWPALSSGALVGEMPQKRHRHRPGGGGLEDTENSADLELAGRVPREAGSLTDSGYADDELSDSLKWPPRGSAGGTKDGVNAWMVHAERALQRGGGSSRSSAGSSQSLSRSSGMIVPRAPALPPRRFRGLHVADTSRDLEGVVERMHGNAPLAPPRHVVLADSASADGGGGGGEGCDTTRSVSDTGRLSGDSAAKVLVGPWGVSAEGESSGLDAAEHVGGWNNGPGVAEDNEEMTATLYRVAGASHDGRSPGRSGARSPGLHSPQRWAGGQPPLQWSVALQPVPEGHSAEPMLSSDDGGTLSAVPTATSRPASPHPSVSPKSPVPPLPSLPPAPDSGEWPADDSGVQVAGESLLTARGLLRHDASVNGSAREADMWAAAAAAPGSPRPQPTLDSPNARPPPQRPKPLLPLPSPHPLNAPQSQSPRRGAGHPPAPQSQLQPLQPQSQPLQPPPPAPAAPHPQQPGAPSTALWSMLTGSSGSLDASCEALADRLAELAAESTKPLLYGVVQLVEDAEPRVSRQGVVAFAERLRRDNDPPPARRASAPGTPPKGPSGAASTLWQPVAVKFFIDDGAFDRCHAVAQDPAVRMSGAKALLEVMPRVADLPASVVVLKGVNMEAWARRQAERQRSDSGSIAAAGLLRPPARKALTALSEVAEAMHAMHSCGWICGALKPSNVAWCAALQAWAIIDFSYAARIGARLPLVLSSWRELMCARAWVCRCAHHSKFILPASSP